MSILLTTCMLVAGASDPADVKVVDEIVAKVNGAIITRSEVGQSKDQDLRDRIDHLLLIARAKELDINVDGEITRRIARFQAASRIADPDLFHQWLSERSGMSFEDWKQQETEGELQRRVIGQEVAWHVNLHEEELRDYYERHKTDFVRQEQVFLREILVAGGASAEKKARDLAARARNGEKFSDLARLYSDAETAKNDGELGGFKRGDLIKEIEDVVFKAARGYISDPIRTAVGFEILQVEEHHAAGQAQFEDVKDQIMEKLYMARIEQEMRKYLTRLRQDAFIQIREGYVDSGAAPGKDTSWKDAAMLKPETTTKEEVAAQGKKKRALGVPVP